MYQQRVKLQRISLVALALACLITIIALMKNIMVLMLFVQYCITLSICCEGLICQIDLKRQTALRLLLLGVLLFIMTTVLLFRYLKS